MNSYWNVCSNTKELYIPDLEKEKRKERKKEQFIPEIVQQLS